MFEPMATVDGSDKMKVLANSDVIVVTAGAKQRPGQTRMALAEANVEMCRHLIPELVRVASQAILLMVTNPVDVVTYVSLKLSGLENNRVLGSGCVLDGARFRFLIAQHCGVAVQNVHAYIAGEHGDSEVPLWSGATIGSIPVSGWDVSGFGMMTENDQREIEEQVRSSAYKIIQGKGATNYAVGLAVSTILQAILWDEKRVLSVSSLITDCCGSSDVCIALPSIVDFTGVRVKLPVTKSAEEEHALRSSAETIRQMLRSLGF
jgi:L-lactate dehydrogenase